MSVRMALALFVFLLIGLNGYLLHAINGLAGRYISERTRGARLRGQVQDLQGQVSAASEEDRLIGRRVPRAYVDGVLEHRDTVVLLATSQDCSPCTVRELRLWNEFLQKAPRRLRMVCLYHRAAQEQYAKYEQVYRAVLPFHEDPGHLAELLKIQHTPVVLLIDGAGKITLAHRPDVLHPEKTERFAATLLRAVET